MINPIPVFRRDGRKVVPAGFAEGDLRAVLRLLAERAQAARSAKTAAANAAAGWSSPQGGSIKVRPGKF